MSFTKLCVSTLAALAMTCGAAEATIDVGGAKIEDTVDRKAASCNSMAQASATGLCSRSMRLVCILVKKQVRLRKCLQRLARSE